MNTPLANDELVDAVMEGLPRRDFSRSCSSSDESAGSDADPAVGLLRDMATALSLRSVWQFDSEGDRVYCQAGHYEANRAKATEVIELFVRVATRQMLEERLALGWAPASPTAHLVIEADDAAAFRYTMEVKFKGVSWLYVIRAWEFVIGCYCGRFRVSPDPYPDSEISVSGMVWELVETKNAQIRNSVYCPHEEDDWA